MFVGVSLVPSLYSLNQPTLSPVLIHKKPRQKAGQKVQYILFKTLIQIIYSSINSPPTATVNAS